MKFRLFRTLLLLICLPSSHVKAQHFLWVNHAGGNGTTHNQGIALASDHFHNTVVTGTFSNQCYFGTLPLTAAGPFSIFLARYDSTGNQTWLRAIGGDSTDESTSVATDAAGNIYVAGNMRSPFLVFDPFHHLMNGSKTNWNGFLARYDSNGNFVWAKGISSTAEVRVLTVTTDVGGNVVAGGYYKNIANFGDTLLEGGRQNTFLAKYTASGTLLWARHGQSGDNCFVKAATCDDAGNIYVTGKLSGSIAFETDALGTIINQSFNNTSLPAGFSELLPDATLAFTPSGMIASGGTGGSSNFLYYNYFSNLEHFLLEATLTVQTPGAGIGIGKFSGGPALALFPLSDTGVNRIVITNFDPLGYSDGYTIAAGDSIHIAMMRRFDTISATLTNYTRHYTATAGYRYLIGPPVSNAGMPNNGPYGLFFSGGVQRVYNFKLSSAENRHALCAFTGNSITTGYYSGGKGHRYQDVLYGNSPYLYATNAGAGDRLIHVLKDTTEMISLHPKYAFINIGVNDANSGADTVEFRNGYEQLIQSYKHNGIVPVLGTLTPQAGNTVLAYNRAIRGAGVADTLCVVDIWRALVDTNTGTMQTMYNYGDYIHPNTAGNLAMAAAIAREAPFLLADTSDWNNSHQVVALPKGQDRVWVAKFNAAGELLWLNADTTTVPYASLPGNALSCGNAIGTSNGNSVYVGGSLLDAIVNITGTPTTVRDAFVSRFDGNSGARVWQKRWGINTLDAVTGLGVSPTEQVYITGNFGGEISFNDGTLQSDQANMFVAKLDADGNELWSRAAAGQAIYSSGLALDPEDSAVLVTGCFNNTATFDSIIASSVATASFYNYDLFVGRISGTNEKLGVNRFRRAAETLVYPDPAIDQVHIYFGGHALHKINVTDVTGRVVYQQSESEQASTIEVKNWISGLYIISVSSDEGISFHKIVKVQ